MRLCRRLLVCVCMLPLTIFILDPSLEILMPAFVCVCVWCVCVGVPFARDGDVGDDA